MCLEQWMYESSYTSFGTRDQTRVFTVLIILVLQHFHFASLIFSLINYEHS